RGLKGLCTRGIGSLLELLQGRLSQSVMGVVTDPKRGLFPLPREIEFDCSCPDYADMCKHVAAVLYGVGARLDAKPELLFRLRGVDQTELIAGAGQDLAVATVAPASAKVLADADAAALFGLDMADSGAGGDITPAPPK